MPNIDQFESVFKAADKTVFAPEQVDIRSVLIVTDAVGSESEQFAAQVKSFLSVLETDTAVSWTTFEEGRLSSVSALLAAVEQTDADLICTYRNLRISATEHPYSLGVYVDVLAQVATAPVMLLPAPQQGRDVLLQQTRKVMAVTDHLTGDHHLVSCAARYTARDGTLFLTHVEDEATFERYMATIAKLPAIDTDTARHDLREQLLKEPHDYVRSCREVLHSSHPTLRIEEIVKLGRRLADYKQLIADQHIDLLVLNTKDEHQLAMHGQAYPLTVELRETPLLLL